MEDPRSAARSANKVDSTAFLREKLGFNDDSRWKRFSNRRLELINTLRLDEQKASKQEPQIRQVAEKVAKEFNYTAEAIPDFERLVRLGIQSVRRNRRRPTKTGSLATTTFDVEVQHPPQMISPQSIMENPLGALIDACRPLCPTDNPLISAGALRLALGLASEPHQLAPAQTLLTALETGALGDEIAKVVGAQSLSHAITSGCTRDQAICVYILRLLLVEFLSFPDLGSMIHYVKNSEFTLHSPWTASQPQPGPSRAPGPGPGGPSHVPTLSPTAMAPVLPVAPPLPPVPSVGPAVVPAGPHVSPHSVQIVGAVPSPATLPPLKGPMWAERLVTLSHKNLEFKFTFSPLNGSPPSLHDIIESCRTSFGLSTSDVLRVRIRESGKIIDTNADLADAFLSNNLNLEIFLPPKPEPQFPQ